jgi:FkbM family methyltransferase
MSEFSSDWVSVQELAIRDVYTLDNNFRPDLVIDGGGNIGLFTLRTASSLAYQEKAPTFVIYEPMEQNAEQIQRHLAINGIKAEVVRACIGGSARSIPFYCREANLSSFDPSKPYRKVIDMPVHLLGDIIRAHPASSVLIKLDIEGMEIEALSALLEERGDRPIYLVGELHHFSENAPLLARIFEKHGWTYNLGQDSDDHSTFRACSPAAFPVLHDAQLPSQNAVTV